MKRALILAAVAFAALLAGCGGQIRDDATVHSELDKLMAEPGERQTTWYVMEQGDTLYSIARRHGTTVADIQLLNPELGDPTKLSIGTRVRVPVPEGGLPAPRPSSSAPSTPAGLSAGPVQEFVPVSGQRFIWPVRGQVVTRFGDRTGGEGAAQSRGIDIRANAGTDVVAARDGIVYLQTGLRDYGNVITIDHGGGAASFYGHLRDVRVGTGDRVRQGQPIGKVDAGGRLHFRVIQGSSPVDPMRSLPTGN